MRPVLKLAHLVGLAVFLGSIAVYILLTSQHLPPGSAAYAQLRAQVLLGTEALTRPALLLTVASGIGLLLAQRGKLQRWQLLKAVIGLLLLINTQLFVVPAIRAAATLAAPGHGASSALAAAVSTESAAGAVNLLLALAAMGLAIVRPSLLMRRDGDRASAQLSGPR